MTNFSRRAFALSGLAGAFFLGACDNRRTNSSVDRIEGRVDSTLAQMYAEFPRTRAIAARSSGMLVMPLITEAGLGFGGGFGRGALRIGGSTVDYFTATKANFGIQIGANQYAHVLFFMTEDSLRDFRESDGWAAGADVDATFLGDGESLSTNTATAMSPVVGIVFGQAGIRLGATIEGTKYSRMFES